MTSTEDCRGCSPCAWTSGQGSDCPITPDKLNFTSTKKTVVLLMHILWQRSVQISPNSSAHYQQQFFPTNISECSQRNQSNKADPGLPSFTGESTITWTLSDFSPWYAYVLTGPTLCMRWFSFSVSSQPSEEGLQWSWLPKQKKNLRKESKNVPLYQHKFCQGVTKIQL